MRKLVSILAVLAVLGMVLAGCVAPAAPAAPAASADAAPAADAMQPSDMTFTTVVKIAGIDWFNRMEVGVKEFGEETGISSSLVGPAQADAAQQIPIIEDLIAQGVDALCVVPMDPAQLDPVLLKAMDAGIKVVTHEASNQVNMDYDIEAFDNTAYGAGLMDSLAALMGEEGEYAVFVGSLGSKTHMEWANGGIERQKEAYPNMKQYGDINEAFDDSSKAYEKAKEILKANPNIKGFQGSASTDAPGIGQAIEEAGLQDVVSVVGTSLPSLAGELMKTGAVDVIGFWDPAQAGKACNTIALMMEKGETIGEGTDLGIEGYHNLIAPLDNKNVLFGDAAVYMTVDQLDQYNF